MSEVKAFTGFIAIDGSTHSSKTAAINHTREVKVKTALQTAFGCHSVTQDQNGDEEQEGQAKALDVFIYENREAILEALNQEVLTRKKRAPNKAKINGAKPKTPAALA